MPNILFEDKELLVIDKPAGLIVHSDGRTEESSVVDWILAHRPEIRGVGESWTSPQGEVIPLPGIVHRLDRATSGVLLIAKTQEMYRYLKGEFKARRIEKTYRALVHGEMEAKEGTIVAEIVRVSDGEKKKWATRPTVEGDKRAAITQWKLLEQREDAALLDVKPLTGRTHQIRVHLSSIGHPIVSDPIYGKADGAKRLMLHASQIAVHVNGARTIFSAPCPAEFLV